MAPEAKPVDFFVVSKGPYDSSHDTEYIEADGSRFGDAPRCGVCGQFIGGRPWLPPFRVEITLHGTEWGDFAFFGNGEFLVSERAGNVFRQAGLTGLSGFEPVEVVRTSGTRVPPPTYLHVVIARTPAMVDESRSRLIRPEPPTCERCRSALLEGIDGFVIDPGSWDGTDVFFARGLTGVVIASSAFRDVVDSAKLTNARLIPTSDFKWDPYAPLST